MSETVRAATQSDLPAVRNVIDGAGLEPGNGLNAALSAGDVLVAVSDRGTVLGAIVCRDGVITSIAVRRRRRGQGIGTALVERVTDRHQELSAEFDTAVSPFWAAVGFESEPIGNGRCLGRRQSAESNTP